ncbi:MAG: hypothetical protein HN833_04370 [Elusimicrobiaceae bacterium]|jgi:hypothetical protein|nr:hypothetical protein [Elusimicrobiaceae bacterium]MBT3954638.1 hypothetical protein [Elusimicrobiaceae bacterium]MBT4007946.1 hypothetical protein [Elusimicrobiaceae bacterium]MBT4403303.1 hypothetical protein [Elusimicrobiaceae bacterium]MBT4439960.1 hypothetical protein [Elusimicrobiaceae bacterium]
MKIELKSVPLSSLVFSVYPIACFAIGIVYSIINAFYTTYATVSAMLTQVMLMSVAYMFMLVFASVIFMMIYNLLCSMGMKGIVLNVEDKQ